VSDSQLKKHPWWQVMCLTGVATIEECSDRLDVLVGSFLDMSRITSDSVNPMIRPVRWYEVIPAGLHGIPAGRVRVELPGIMPEVDADAGMLERVIANITENAVKYAPDSDVVLVGAARGLSPATLGGRPAGELRIIEHGQGVPAGSVVRMFQPFQRLDDVPQATGVGLGLAGRRASQRRWGGNTGGRKPRRRTHHGHPAAAVRRRRPRPRFRPGAAGSAVRPSPSAALTAPAQNLGRLVNSVLVVDDDPHTEAGIGTGSSPERPAPPCFQGRGHSAEDPVRT
jgi:hypothetical protein